MRIRKGKSRGHRKPITVSATDPSLAILLCRVSSKKQAEGYSLDFQERNGRTYAANQGFTIPRSPFRITETASKVGQREEFADFLDYVRSHPERHVLIPKVDRCLRNFDDLALIAKFPAAHDKVLHFFDDGLIYHKDSPPADLLRLGIQGTVATWYSADLSVKVGKGMAEKVEQGGWPNRAPFGYRNTPDGVEPDPREASWLVRIKQLAATRDYAIDRIVSRLQAEGCTLKLTRNLIERVIRNPFASGRFSWKGTLYDNKGSYKPLITWKLHQESIAGLERLNKPKYRVHNWAYSGLVQCALCGRAIIFEEHKKNGREYRYGHCSGVRYGKENGCKNIYLKENEFELGFGEALRAIQIKPEIAAWILEEAAHDADKETLDKETQLATLKIELARLKTMIDRSYEDKLSGAIPESYWREKTRRWQEEQFKLD